MQFRVYVVYIAGALYVYKHSEVRLPEWDLDLDSHLPSAQQNEHSRAYNSDRNKQLTMRCVLDELSELPGDLETLLLELVVVALSSLRPLIRQQVVGETKKKKEMAIVGVDLIVSSVNGRLVPFILEFNNNPAIAGEDKNMSSSYRMHLLHLMQSIVMLACRGERRSVNSVMG